MTYNIENDDLLKAVREDSFEELEVLASDIRNFLIHNVSKTGGHLASNLGIVELTIAMHRVYDSPRDKIVFDVGHQAYIHKILTGRASKFDTLRKYKGLSGFPKSRESEHDAYETGHSSTSISAAMGLATARDLKGEDYNVVAVIGDGSMTGGLCYEALNNLGASNTNMKIILNDNGMSISHNVGGLSKYLTGLRGSKNYMNAKDKVKNALDIVPLVGHALTEGISVTKNRIKHSVIGRDGALFEDLGIKYLGPVDGYDMEALCEVMDAANRINGPVIIHVITKKGKGYEWSEKYPRKFHGIAPFDKVSGNILSSTHAASYSQVFGDSIASLALENDQIVAIAAAMGTATGLGKFYDLFPERYFDVGIAEEHAVVFAAGLAKSGLTPVVAIYSSFLQRAFDMIIEDICLQNLHVVFAIDRAGLVGADGETHHGQFDLSYLSMIPNLTILAPADGAELSEMLSYAINELDGPVAIRYPRGSATGHHKELPEFNGSNNTIQEGKDVTILAVGAMLDEALTAADELTKHNYNVGVRNVGVIKPFDDSLLDIDSKLIVTVEDNSINGGFGSQFASRFKCKGNTSEVVTIGIPDAFIEHGSVTELRKECSLDADAIVKGALKVLEGKA